VTITSHIHRNDSPNQIKKKKKKKKASQISKIRQSKGQSEYSIGRYGGEKSILPGRKELSSIINIVTERESGLKKKVWNENLDQ
jgi:hypothetical protein